MTAVEVRELHDREKREYAYAEERRWEQEGQEHRSLETITVGRSFFEELNGKPVDIVYAFEDRRISQVSIRFLRPLEDSLRALKGPWGLVEKGRGSWEGLEGKIRAYPHLCNAEWEERVVRLNFPD